MIKKDTPGKEIRLILADDHAVVRSGTRQLLERQPDFNIVGEASDGSEAIDMTRRLKPDVVVMDVRMPRVSGVEATKRIKAEMPEVNVLVMTAHDDDEYVFALLQAGANGYLLKTAEIEELVQAIRLVASGQSALAPEVTGKVVAQFTSGKSLPDVLASTQDSYDGLTERELGVLKLVGQGLSNKQIGKKLFISDRTVQAHLSNIFSKLGVSSRTEAVMHAVRKGWISG
ncbi:response regulator transcription factor [Anaerolineales bacterium HSG6]|nr:response regulator transcription factor [Anaerolineales bacterium HSG6]MDM8531794.1 response regulator transcription factor [Anaerolineales bacterium HSG25]